MDLFIRIQNGQPFEHPILGDNFRQAFPDVDVDNLPPQFAKFERVPRNVTPGIFEVAELHYEWFDTIVKDVWSVRPMTDQEKADKIAKYKANPPFPSWTFNEATLEWSAPTPKPDDGQEYRWDEDTLSWVVFVQPAPTS